MQFSQNVCPSCTNDFSTYRFRSVQEVRNIGLEKELLLQYKMNYKCISAEDYNKSEGISKL